MIPGEPDTWAPGAGRARQAPTKDLPAWVLARNRPAGRNGYSNDPFNSLTRLYTSLRSAALTTRIKATSSLIW
jgi:hypothetical protein